MELSVIVNWVEGSVVGMLCLSFGIALILMLFLQQLTKAFKWLLKPAVEQTFYNTILNNWLGPFFSRHKIIATFIRAHGLGETVVDSILHLTGTFFVVALLSSTLTAMLIFIKQNGFSFSVYLIALVSMVFVWSWILIRNLIYFYRVIHRLE